MSERKPVVLVTGASGFVGRQVAPELAREGWSVRRAVRSPMGIDGEVVIELIGPILIGRLEDAGARQRHEDLGDQAAAGLWRGRQGAISRC
ncbi:NAD-dependent epimerase/dehydratase family protein [Bradyrhizobium japonicum]|uniref:NAD-dependent epimerase/dehydratase family protein n=1 Tax=Bradyrhizobium japonicum TaxID=375 RepID=UPI00201148FB|nr:NAD-dependent epimerase/dehydratase family protein [Bradyrhizobium japonicum]